MTDYVATLNNILLRIDGTMSLLDHSSVDFLSWPSETSRLYSLM
jgi:hypothetical protein